jgi:hypothetical protein
MRFRILNSGHPHVMNDTAHDLPQTQPMMDWRRCRIDFSNNDMMMYLRNHARGYKQPTALTISNNSTIPLAKRR